MANIFAPRNSSIELLRILCMMCIIGHHIITNVLSVNFQYPLYTFADCLMHVAVIVFVLITGYFGIHFRLHKVVALETELIYYSFIASCIAFFCLQTVHIKDLILSLFPVTRHVYWFMSAYMELYLVSPLINKLLDRLSKRQFIYMLLVFGFSYCVLFNGDTFNAGTNLTGFTFLYVLGRFIRQYGIYERLNIRILVSCLVIYVLFVLACSFLPTTGRIFPHFISWFYRYNGVGNIFFGVVILGLFCHWTFYSPLINRMAKSVLAIYLIHENHAISQYVYVKPVLYLQNSLHLMGGVSMLVMVIMITLSCIAVDQIRIFIFRHLPFERVERGFVKIINKI